MGSLRGRARNLEREMETELVTVRDEDGGVSRWPLGDDLFKEVFLHEIDRGNRHHNGEDPEPAHPFVVPLRTAANLEDLMGEQGTILGFWAGEDEVIRGLKPPAPAPRWRKTRRGLCAPRVPGARGCRLLACAWCPKGLLCPHDRGRSTRTIADG